MQTNDLRYPIGEFRAPSPVSTHELAGWIDDIEQLPKLLHDAVDPLTPEQLETAYRPGGWCVRQVVHHIADSHMNSVVRFKWALTENRPEIKTYYEERWAELDDYTSLPVLSSLSFLEILHARWAVLLRGLTGEELGREFLHPDSGTVRLDENIGIYAWHGRHHLAHITHLAARNGWGS